VVADFDKVSGQNLERQYYFRSQIGEYKVDALARTLAHIDPDAAITAHRVRLDPISLCELYKGCQIIVEAFDDAEAKAMLIETCLGAFPGTHVVSASGLAGVGRFDSIRIVHRGMLHICGDFENEVSEASPPVAPRVAIVANLEADIVLDLLLEWACARRPQEKVALDLKKL
jgi:sulfur carrier protein ThiS adenylyltransferase